MPTIGSGKPVHTKKCLQEACIEEQKRVLLYSISSIIYSTHFNKAKISIHLTNQRNPNIVACLVGSVSFLAGNSVVGHKQWHHVL